MRSICTQVSERRWFGWGKERGKEEADTYNPDGREEKGQLNASEVGVSGSNNDSAVVLDANAHTHYTEIHECEGPYAPVD